MKRKVRTSWVEFFKTGKLSKYVDKPILPPIKSNFKMPPVKPIKPVKKKPKKYIWECITTFIGGRSSTIETVDPDSNEYNGYTAFEGYLEWFQCSNNPSYVMKSKDNINVYPRDKIIEIQISKKEMK